EHVDAIDLDSVHAVCLSYLDPAALPRVKQTVRRLARQAPELPLLVGLWNVPETARTRLGTLPANANVVTSLREAVQAVELAAAPSEEYLAAPIPPDEQERLADLKALRALEGSDEQLARYTRRL